MVCRKSTMGFAPEIPKYKSKWLEDDGKKFMSIVQAGVDTTIGENVIIQDKNELISNLRQTISIRGDDANVINELIQYSVQLCVGRVRLDERLTSIRDNMIRLQPRGCYNRDKGCLPFADVKGVSKGSIYNQFLEQQKQYR